MYLPFTKLGLAVSSYIMLEAFVLDSCFIIDIFFLFCFCRLGSTINAFIQRRLFEPMTDVPYLATNKSLISSQTSPSLNRLGTTGHYNFQSVPPKLPSTTPRKSRCLLEWLSLSMESIILGLKLINYFLADIKILFSYFCFKLYRLPMLKKPESVYTMHSN